jgi:hypothetical protein
MSGRKTIQINPAFFNMRGSKSRRKERKQKPSMTSTLKPNNIKKQLLKRIKEHQQQKKADSEKQNTTEEEKFTSEFSNSLDYIQKMINEKRRQKKRRRNEHTRRKINRQLVPTGNKQLIPTNGVQKHSNPEHGKPLWGCLKGGSLPTWSQYKQTLKKKDVHHPKPKLIIPEIPKPTAAIMERQKNLSKIKETLLAEKPAMKKKMKMKRSKRTLKIHTLGKKDNKVGVLIKSGKTRKMVKNEVEVLRKKSIIEIKKYLRKHNIIKAGSAAPEPILRRLYEDSYLAGDIYNRNADTLLHNYIHNK